MGPGKEPWCTARAALEAWLPEAGEAEGIALEHLMILAAPDGSERRPWSALRPPLR